MIWRLKRFAAYTREEAASVLAPEYPFKAQTGTWGIQGIVRFGAPGSFALFVTFGQHQAGHDFDEGVDESGVLRWQSQPGQDLDSPVVQSLITHEETKNDVALFLRGAPKSPYYYLGKLRYLGHDRERERPVHFQWQIMDFSPTSEDLSRMGLRLERQQDFTEAAEGPPPQVVPKFVRTSKPPAGRGGIPVETREYKARIIDYEGRDRTNRNLGRLGEVRVVAWEKERLSSAGRPDLAARVEHVSATQGDGLGFDVKSFDETSGEELLIEVKTTTGPATTPFFLSAAELRFAQAAQSNFRIYRIFNFDPSTNSGSFFELQAADLETYDLIPVSYRAKLR